MHKLYPMPSSQMSYKRHLSGFTWGDLTIKSSGPNQRDLLMKYHRENERNRNIQWDILYIYIHIHNGIIFIYNI